MTYTPPPTYDILSKVRIKNNSNEKGYDIKTLHNRCKICIMFLIKWNDITIMEKRENVLNAEKTHYLC